jgi:hypothetical protein
MPSTSRSSLAAVRPIYLEDGSVPALTRHRDAYDASHDTDTADACRCLRVAAAGGPPLDDRSSPGSEHRNTMQVGSNSAAPNPTGRCAATPNDVELVLIGGVLASGRTD